MPEYPWGRRQPHRRFRRETLHPRRVAFGIEAKSSFIRADIDQLLRQEIALVDAALLATAHHQDRLAASAMVADPLRLMDICATSDGGAALIVSSVEYAKRIGKGDAPRVGAKLQFTFKGVEYSGIVATADQIDGEMRVSFKDGIATTK